MRAVLLNVLEALFVAAALTGLAFVAGWPWALLVGGVLGIILIEANDDGRRPRKAPATVHPLTDRDSA